MADKDRSAGADALADQKNGVLEIDCERRTGKLTTGKVRPGQLLEVNREPLKPEPGAGSREPVEEEDGEEIVQ